MSPTNNCLNEFEQSIKKVRVVMGPLKSLKYLKKKATRTIAVGVDSDRLYLPSESCELADGIPNARYAEITSPYGHDSFLVETTQVAALVKELLDG